MSLEERLAAALDRTSVGPLHRGDDVRFDERVAGTPAAVLIAVTDRPEPGVILTERAATLRNHGGQVAFPGGRIDPEDNGPVAAALREAAEEIALDSGAARVVGTLPPYRTVTGYEVVPVLAVIPPDLPLAPSEAEVAAVFEPPLAFLLDPANSVERAVEWQGRERRFREILWGGHRIWGATAAMLANLRERLAWTG